MSRKILTPWWPLPIGIAAFVAQQVGWDRIGRAVLSVARAAGEVAWPVAREGWMLLAAGLLILWLYRSGPRVVVTRLGRVPRRWLLLGLAGGGVLSVLAVVVLLAPPVFVPEDPALNLQELYRARNDVRTTLLQAVAGLVLLLGAYFTYRQVQNSTRALQHTQQQVEIARAGQVTERFTRAIDQLGQHGSDKLDIRLGGIYALERIARDSADDRTAVVEVFCAYVREHAPWPPRAGQYVADAPLEEVLALQARASDVQAILTVLGRGVFAGQYLRLDLRDADLRNADLQQAQLRKTRLGRAHLRGADLGWADLTEADLHEANLTRAHLTRAHLTKAHLDWADLTEADLHGANLTKAHLTRAHLTGADLRWADLTEADLTEADLHGADLRRAIADRGTQWPEGFDWKATGVEMHFDDSASDVASKDQATE